MRQKEEKQMNPETGDFITDVYGHRGVVASVYYDYIRLTDGKHVYKSAIAKIIKDR